MLNKYTHIAKFISTSNDDVISHGTKVLVDMTNGHTKLKPVKVDDGSEIPFRVVATGAKLNTNEYDVIEKRDDYTVLVPFGARVKHAKYLFQTGDVKKKVAAIAQIKELVLRNKRARNDFALPENWHEAMSAFTDFCNTENQSAGSCAFDAFNKMLNCTT